MTRDQEISVEDAERRLRQEYWDDVRAICDDLKAEIKAGNVEDEEAADEWLHQTVDGHENVIYTGKAIKTLLWSDNDSAHADEIGTDGMIEGGEIQWSRLAYFALLADVRDTLGDLSELFAEPETEE